MGEMREILILLSIVTVFVAADQTAITDNGIGFVYRF